MMGISKSSEMEEVIQAEETTGLEAGRQGTPISIDSSPVKIILADFENLHSQEHAQNWSSLQGETPNIVSSGLNGMSVCGDLRTQSAPWALAGWRGDVGCIRAWVSKHSENRISSFCTWGEAGTEANSQSPHDFPEHPCKTNRTLF